MSKGRRTTSFGYKRADGTWAFRYSAPTVDVSKVAQVRQQAIDEAHKLNSTATPARVVTNLIDRYFKWQDGMAYGNELRKAASTLKENRRERKCLDGFFGKMIPDEIKPKHIYAYLDGRGQTAPSKANKEIALLSAVLEYGRRIGEIEENPCRGIQYNPTRPRDKLADIGSINYSQRVARDMGGQFLIAALCAKAAYHAVGRPDEMRALLRSSVHQDGLQIPVGKRKRGQAQRHKLAEWNADLKAAIDEALAARKVASIYVFANARGGSYNRNSWANVWKKLMDACEQRAKADGVAFARFSLADMRPASVTKRMDDGDDRITDATGHSDGKMVAKVYDRRKVKRFRATE